MEELLRAKFTVKDALAVIKRIEQDPEKAKGLANIYYQSDYSHSEGSDPDLIEIERTVLKEERAKEKRQQQKFIEKMELKYPTVDVEKILNKKPSYSYTETESEKSSEEVDLEAENELSSEEI